MPIPIPEGATEDTHDLYAKSVLWADADTPSEAKKLLVEGWFASVNDQLGFGDDAVPELLDEGDRLTCYYWHRKDAPMRKTKWRLEMDAYDAMIAAEEAAKTQ